MATIIPSLLITKEWALYFFSKKKDYGEKKLDYLHSLFICIIIGAMYFCGFFGKPTLRKTTEVVIAWILIAIVSGYKWKKRAAKNPMPHEEEDPTAK